MIYLKVGFLSYTENYLKGKSKPWLHFNPHDTRTTVLLVYIVLTPLNVHSEASLTLTREY